jgi:hypothetical protein
MKTNIPDLSRSMDAIHRHVRADVESNPSLELKPEADYIPLGKITELKIDVLKAGSIPFYDLDLPQFGSVMMSAPKPIFCRLAEAS